MGKKVAGLFRLSRDAILKFMNMKKINFSLLVLFSILLCYPEYGYALRTSTYCSNMFNELSKTTELKFGTVDGDSCMKKDIGSLFRHGTKK